LPVTVWKLRAFLESREYRRMPIVVRNSSDMAYAPAFP
jgi:hypothetical protein